MKLHETCTTDQAAPQFDHEWQRRAFGLAVALAEFGHYRWGDFQQNLIETIEHWQRRPESQRGDWQYYDHWIVALEKVITDHHLLTAATRQSHGRHPKPVPEKA
jgi:nitrile hydratase accessory protein